MLGLKLPTDPRWVNIVESNIEEILTDHAWCEQKAATNAITILTVNSEHEELVIDLLALAKEELSHFEMVLEIIRKRGLKLGRERKDSYVNELYQFMRKGGSRNDALIDRLLFAAMIEARSCERFRVLSLNINDKELASFYHELM
jgi:tRNA-(ms[2]io[6]A)-hydroxylase